MLTNKIQNIVVLSPQNSRKIKKIANKHNIILLQTRVLANNNKRMGYLSQA